MLGIKTFFSKKINSKFEKILNKNSLPKKGFSLFEKQIVELAIAKRLKNENWDDHIQAPISQFTHPVSRRIFKKIIPFNPNNLGNWSQEKPFHVSGLLEKKALKQIISLLTKRGKNLGGYITSGGTEANIYMLWLGKKALKKKLKTTEMLLIKTGLTHYSIQKAADVTEIETTDVSISSQHWGISVEELEKTIKDNFKKGKKGVILPLTMGYTITGSDDPIKEIDTLIENLQKELKGLKVFCWIDAAFSGIIKPFVENRFDPFSYKIVSGFITDFHKFPSFPYPSGVVVYKKPLIKNVEKKVEYIERNDTTLLGSRSGAISIMLWYCLNSISKSGFEKMVKKSLKRKNKYLGEIKNKLPEVEIITTDDSVQAGIFGKKKNEKKVLKKMGLEPTTQRILMDGKRKNLTIYKLYFLPFFKN